jgi:hypothetical protein
MFKALILSRMREPSTYAGISVLLAMFGVPPGVPELVGQVIAGLGGVAAILLGERKS